MTYRKTQLTPAKKKFAEVYARTDNGSEAVRRAYPELSNPDTIKQKANRLVKNHAVSLEIDYQKQKLEKLASKAVDKLEKLIDSENETVATTNLWNTIWQVQGKAAQKTTNLNVSATLEEAVSLLQ